MDYVLYLIFHLRFLITQAVDRAVENPDDPSIEQVARRCLQVHNLNVSAQAANIPAEKSVPLFFKHLKNEAKRKEYDIEFEKQLKEIKGALGNVLPNSLLHFEIELKLDGKSG